METDIQKHDDQTSEIDNRTIVVTNLSPNVEEKTISELFSFCGDIDFIKIIKSESTATSIIQFRSSNSTKTSLILSGATLDGRFIEVSYATKEVLESLKVNIDTNKPEVEQKEEDISIDDRSPSTVIAKILAKGYRLSDKATAEAKKLDEEWKVSSSIKHVYEDAKTNFKSFDEKYKISETAKNLTDKAVDSAKEISQKIHLTETATSISEKASSWFNSISTSIYQTIDSMTEKGSEFIENNFGNVVNKLKDVTGKASEQFEEINTKAQKIYESDKETSQSNVQLEEGDKQEQSVNVVENVENEQGNTSISNNNEEVYDNVS